MAKKHEEVFDTSRALQLIGDIEYDLLFRLQFSENNNFLTEEDCRTLVQIDNKAVCYPKDAYPNDHTIIGFDPFFNKKLAYFLFQRYVYMYMSEHPNVQISSFSLAYSLTDTNKMFAVCKTNHGDIQSNLFVNDTLCWIDLILKMDNSQYPLQDFEYIDQAITYIRKAGIDGRNTK